MNEQYGQSQSAEFLFVSFTGQLIEWPYKVPNFITLPLHDSFLTETRPVYILASFVFG